MKNEKLWSRFTTINSNLNELREHSEHLNFYFFTFSFYFY
jgi:hypothetical protein